MMMKRTLNLQANLIAEQGRFELGLDKLSQTWYNILMRKTMKETFGIYQGKAVVVIAAFAVSRLTTDSPVSPSQRECAASGTLGSSRLESGLAPSKLDRTTSTQAGTLDMDITTTIMMAALIIPIIMIGAADAKRHPWGKHETTD